MKAIDLPLRAWFSRSGDHAIYQRAEGEPEVVEGVLAIPVRVIFPRAAGYVPADEEVTLDNRRIVRLN